MIERDVPPLRFRLSGCPRARRHRRALDDPDPARPPARGAPEVSGFPAVAPRDQPEHALEQAPSSARARHRHTGVLWRAPAPSAVRADRQGAGPRSGAADASGLGHGAHAPDEVTPAQAAVGMARLANSVSTRSPVGLTTAHEAAAGKTLATVALSGPPDVSSSVPPSLAATSRWEIPAWSPSSMSAPCAVSSRCPPGRAPTRRRSTLHGICSTSFCRRRIAPPSSPTPRTGARPLAARSNLGGRSLWEYELDGQDESPRRPSRGPLHVGVGLDLRGASLSPDRECPPDPSSDRHRPLTARAGLPVRRDLRAEGEIPVVRQEQIDLGLEEHRVDRGARRIAGERPQVVHLCAHLPPRSGKDGRRRGSDLPLPGAQARRRRRRELKYGAEGPDERLRAGR